MLRRFLVNSLLTALLTSVGLAQSPGRGVPAANPPAICGGQPGCSEVSSFAATLTDFRTSTSGRYKVLSATLRFQNKLSRPLILGYLNKSGVGIDDQGNRYEVYPSSVRGIGTIASTIDPKFVLQPGESSDGRFEFVWAPDREIIGTVYELELTFREIIPLPGNQFRLGLEHVIRYQGLRSGFGGPAVSSQPMPPSAASPAPIATSPAQVPESADFCAGKPRCYSAGSFTAEVLQVTGSRVSNSQHHLLRINVRLRNMTNQPLILGYKARTSQATDNYGNPYTWGRPGSGDGSSIGIGMVDSNKADPSFVLNPGESRDATFQVIRFSPGRSAIGTEFAWNLALEQLEILPSRQIRTTREYSVSFQNLTASGMNPFAQSADSLKDIFRMKKK